MREILFRGKDSKTKNWVCGYYFKAVEHWTNKGIHEDWIACTAIQNGGMCNVCIKFPVLKDTVGQFTGVTDKNGKKIFEGDIVKCDVWLFEKKGVVEFGRGTFDSGIYKYTGFYLREANGEIDHNPIYNFDEEYENCLVVIGNIHDNPELLEGVCNGD